MADTGADIRLLVGVARGGTDGDSEALIRSELQEIMASINKNPIKVAVQLSGGDSGKKSLAAQIQEQLTKIGTAHDFTIRISKMKLGEGAIADFRKQLSAVIRTLNLDKGTTVTLGTDVGKITGSVKETGAAATDTARKIAELKIQMQDLAKQSASIRTGLTSLDKGATEGEATKIAELKTQYQSFRLELETLRNEKGNGTAERRAALEAEGAAILDNISKIQQEREALAQEEVQKKRDVAASEEEVRNQKRVSDARREGITLLKQMQQAEQNWTAAKNGSSAEDYRKISGYSVELSGYITQLENGSMTVEQFRTNLSRLKGAFSESSTSIKLAGEATKTLSERVGGLASKFTSWLTVSQVIMRLYTAARKMVTTVIDIDTAMTELKKVTDETDATYASYLENSTVRAKALGATVADTVNASADFARLGYSLDEAANLADAALVYKNVGDGISDISEASESIISTMKAFKIEASDAMSIVDKFNEVGNRFAISSEGIGQALQRSAAALASTGSTLEESIAMAVGMNDVVQNPEVVGTALKTLSMYMRTAKEEAEEAGESTDGMADSVSQLRERMLELTGFDINIDDNTFKSLYDQVAGIAKVFNQLDASDTKRSEILELMGGKRGASSIASLLTNWEDVEAAYKVAMNAEGSALAENDKYLESIKGHTAEFKAEFETLSNDVIGSDMVKFFVDAGTAILRMLDGITKVVNVAGTLPGIIATIAAAMSFKNVGVFKVADDKTSTTGKRFDSLFSSSGTSSGQEGIDTSSITSSVQSDVAALQAYNAAIQSGKSQTEAFAATMQNASMEAQTYANSMSGAQVSTDEFATKQTQAKVTLAAQDKSFKNVNAVIKTYNSGLGELGLTQQQYTAAVSENNQVLGNYLARCTAGKANIIGYSASLVAAKAATIGLRVATTALNMGIGMLIGIAANAALSLLISGFKKLAELFKSSDEKLGELNEEFEKLNTNVKSASQDFHELQSSLSGIVERYTELAQGVDRLGNNMSLTAEEYEEYVSLNNQIAEMFPEINMGLDANGNAMLALSGDADTLTSSLQALLDVQRMMAHSEIEENIPDLVKNTNKQISLYESQIADVQGEQGRDEDFLNRIVESREKITNIYGSYADYVKAENSRREIVDDAIRNGIYDEHSEWSQWSRELRDLYMSSPDGEGLWESLVNDTRDEYGFDNYYAMFFDKRTDAMLDAYRNSVSSDATDREIEKIRTQEQSQYSALLSSFVAWAETDDNYAKLSDKMRAVASKLVSGIDIAELYEENGELDAEKVQNYITNTILEPLGSMSSEVQEKLAGLFSIPTSDSSINDYIQTVTRTIKDIADNSDLDYSSLFEASGYKDLLEAYNDSAVEIWQALSGASLTTIRKSLSPDEITRSLDYIRKYGIDTWDDLQAALENKTFEVVVDFDTESENLEKLNTAMEESASSAGLTADSIAALKDRYQDLEGYDPERLFEYTTAGIHLNADAVDELEKKYQSLNKTDLDNKLKDLAQRYSDLTDKINACSDASKLAELYTQRDAILDEINDTKDLAAQYEALTSKYNAWQNAKSRANERDQYESIGQSYSDMEKLVNIGWYDNEALTEYNALLLSADRLTNDNAEDFKKLTDQIEGTNFSLMDFFQYDEDNNLTSLGVKNFLDAVHQLLGEEYVKISDDGKYSFDFAGDKLQDVADAIGTTTEFIQIMEKAADEAGFDVVFDSMFSDIDNIIKGSNDALSALKKLKDEGKIKADVDFDFSVTDIKDVEDQIENAKTLLKEFTDEDGTVNLDLEGAEEAATVLATLIYRKSDLEAPAVMSIQVDDEMAQTEIGQALLKLQEFKDAVANLSVQTALGVDTTDAQAKVDEILAEMSENQTITGTLAIDTSSVDTALSGVNGLTTEMLVTAGLDSSEVDDYDPKNLTRTVRFVKNSTSVDNYITLLKNMSLDKTVRISYVSSGYPKSKSHPSDAEGTAHARGTAMLNGDWATHGSGIALGGELGREIVVRDGKFFTIGDDSAELFHFRKGDIIFNAAQTEQILKYGKIANGAKRGTSYAEGSAFDRGSGGKFPDIYTTPIYSIGSSKGSGSSGSSSSNNNSSNNDESTSSIIDWIEIAIKRIERAINRLATVATSPFKKLAERISSTNDELSAMRRELEIQQAGYDRYMQQANSVGLSSDLQERVLNGAIDINEYDEDTAKLISDYREWAEKALDCSDAILELKENIAELYQDKFDTIAEDYENQLSLIEHLTNTYNNGLDDLEARGYFASTKYYEALRKAEQQNISARKKELKDLTAAMSEAINSGSIKENSEAWYDFQTKINDVKEAIQESETAMVEFGNSIREVKWDHFDYLQDQISAITEEADFLIDLMENSDLYTDKGQLTDTGMATMGLHGQNYNVYMAQADKYAKELLSLNKEITNDPNNTKLLDRREELLKAQREAILAAEDEKQAIVDLVRDGIDLELDALKDLISSYTDALDSAKDLFDYQKRIKDQTSEIARLQKQLTAYAGDNSEETKATVQKIQVSLADAMEDLEETQYEHYISDQKKLLDELYDEYETILNQRLDNVDLLIEDMIDKININASSINDTITEESDKVGYTLSESMRQIWSVDGGAYAVIAKYGDSFTSMLTSINNVLNSISIGVASMVDASDKKANSTIKNTTSSTAVTNSGASSSSSSNSSQNNSSSSGSGSGSGTYSLSDKDYYGVALAVWNGNYGWGNGQTRTDNLRAKGFDPSRVQSIVNQMGKDGYVHTAAWIKRYYGISDLSPYHYNRYLHGGLVDYTGLAQLDGSPSEPEMVLDSTDTANLIDLKDALRSIANGDIPLVDLFGQSENAAKILGQLAQIEKVALPGSTSSDTFTYNVTIPIDHVLDYEDFMNQMRRDGRFEKLIQSMTVDRMVGGSRLAKNKYQW